MKHILLLSVLFIGAISFGQGQGDLTIYSNTGDKFYVILNGIRQNDRPETNVKVTGLKERWYSCKVISANNNFEIEKNLGVKFDSLTTYRIIEKKGNYKLRFYTETSLGTVTSQPDQNVVVYHATDNPVTPVNNEVTPSNSGTNINTNVNETTTTTTTIVTTSTTEDLGNNTNGNSTVTGVNGENINMNIQVSEMGMNVNVNTSENGMTTNMNGNTTGGNTTTYHEEITTTTTTTSTGNTNQGNLYQDNDMVVTMETADNNCFTSDVETDQIIKQIESESFSDDQLRVANMAATNKCFSASQIKKIASVFAHSDDQLNFAKTAYDRCSDKNNYYQVMEVFTFSDDKAELEKYINSKK